MNVHRELCQMSTECGDVLRRRQGFRLDQRCDGALHVERRWWIQRLRQNFLDRSFNLHRLDSKSEILERETSDLWLWVQRHLLVSLTRKEMEADTLLHSTGTTTAL